MAKPKRAGWVRYRGDVGDAGPPYPARSRLDARRTYDLSFPALSYCGCGRSALNEQVFAMPAVRARIADIGELRSGAGKVAAP